MVVLRSGKKVRVGMKAMGRTLWDYWPTILVVALAIWAAVSLIRLMRL